jgi:hypothetical protein
VSVGLNPPIGSISRALITSKIDCLAPQHCWWIFVNSWVKKALKSCCLTQLMRSEHEIRFKEANGNSSG